MPRASASPSPSTRRSARLSEKATGTPVKAKATPPKSTKPKPLGEIFKDAGKKALGGGIAGALAMVVQVVALMWMRTTMNYQHKYGTTTTEALQKLYAEGGVARFYQGMSAALLQAPLSRFGDTAANAGMIALLAGVAWMSPATKTFFASTAAALFRIAIMPIDAIKTSQQTDGAKGLALLLEKVSAEGISTLYAGALAASFATFLGHYPWFITYNFLQEKIPKMSGLQGKLRSAGIGFCSSLTSDIVSNPIRVVKTALQASSVSTTYAAVIGSIVEREGVFGLWSRGLTTKLVSNGLQAMLFTVCWRYFEEKLAARSASSSGKAKTKAA